MKQDRQVLNNVHSEFERFEQQANELLIKRNLMPSNKLGLQDFCKYFMAFSWEAHSRMGDGFEMLEVLADDQKLIGGDQFNTNFVKRIDELYPSVLQKNGAWQHFMHRLISFKGKGVGVGELYLALVIQGWSSERTDGKGDGYVAGGRREVKNNGASLKPLADILRVQDRLNKTVFEGHRAGPVTEFGLFKAWISTKPSPEQIYREYFEQLYPGRDITAMVKNLASAQTGREFDNIIGREVLKWYQDVDGWESLVIINLKKQLVANIADINNLSIFTDLRFEWKSERGRDTQALTDGYVNIRI